MASGSLASPRLNAVYSVRGAQVITGPSCTQQKSSFPLDPKLVGIFVVDFVLPSHVNMLRYLLAAYFKVQQCDCDHVQLGPLSRTLWDLPRTNSPHALWMPFVCRKPLVKE